MIIYDNNTIENEIKNSYIALGSFDGFHLGHLSLVKKVKKLAKQNNALSIVFTFKNHPKKFIKPNSNIKLIMNNEEKIKVLEKENIDILALKSFDDEIMKMMPEDFIRWICQTYKVKGIVVGFNFKFGYKNLGDIEILKSLQKKYNYELYIMNPYIFENKIISSTYIRNELLEGNVKKAYEMLTRPYMLLGKIIDGKKLGRTIGFPTANLQVNDSKIIPKKGVYYTNVEINGIILKGMTSIGNNPTVNGVDLTIETYILNFNENIYNKEIKLYFIDKIRDEVKFNSIDELTNQLKKDKNCVENKNIVIC